MKINKMISQHRRDFRADMICEHCDYIEKNVSGYDDSYFHQNVIPDMKCKQCGKKANSDYRAQKPKYSENQII